MMEFPEEVRFRSTWRPYQARVLSELEGHLDDNRLHVVAAPGSGKTVLGLEVVYRINKPTLVLAPTLAIRDQWVQRLVELFLPKKSKSPDWVSRDLTNPGFFTVTTYQSLHSAMSLSVGDELEVTEESEEQKEIEQVEKVEEDLEEEDDTESDIHSWLDQTKKRSKNAPRPDLVALLIQRGVQTIVLDEAHHLRSSWWKSLTSLIKGLGQPKTLALTATPPFDVPPAEWDRYMELCGPVDARVPVPELVMEDNLCPHQDLVVFSTPSEAESAEIIKFRTEVTMFVRNLQTKHQFREFIQAHEWLNPPEIHIEEILDQPEFFSSLLVYLYHHGVEIPKSALEIIADSKSGIPSFNLEWLEILLTGILYPKGVDRPKLNPFLEEIRDELKRIGALERRKVLLRSVASVDKILKQSISKLQRIVEIAQREYESLGDDLRMVVLTDYIRLAFMPQSTEDQPALNKIGVVPIFETIRRAGLKSSKIGILSGSLVIIPKESEVIFRECAMALGIDRTEMTLKALVYDARFLRVNVKGSEKHKLVRAVTDLFTIGGVNLLVGTKSLLGEGWDAPSINSLVLASFVGSYMLSNQMRGRAIRSERGNPDKTANIWHLVCIEPGSHEAGEDFDTMQRRFKAFVGVSSLEPVIENGFARLGVGRPPFKKKDLKLLNENMFLLANNREAIRETWEKALRRGEDGVRLVEDIQAQKVYLPRGFVFRNTISALFWEGIFTVGYILSHTLDNISVGSLEGLVIILLALFIICMVIMAPTTLKAVYLFIKHGPVQSSLKQIGAAILKTLCHIGEMSTDYMKMRVVVEEGEYGEVFCRMDGGSNREKSVYLQALQELLNPIENPRYLLIRKSTWWNRFTRKDYHAVPAVIGAKKEYAEYFADMWAKYVGRMNLVYTRTGEGRIELIRARNKSLSATFRPRSERLTRWK
jgi:superfamily II DNA or RNA helicase